MTEAQVQEAIDELRGAVTIVYPMGLPPHDPIQMELENYLFSNFLNSNSKAFTLTKFGSDSKDITQIGSMLFTRQVSGVR